MNNRDFERDIRNTDPNLSGHRRARFLDGWQDAIKGPQYSQEILRDLTWQNLGYRMGRLFGKTDDDTIVELYDWCVRQQSGSIDT